ncbi:MAG: DNA-processing protein DprA, partial [Beijerinckiaceae bacterium]
MPADAARRVLLSEDQRRDWLRLLRSEGVGPRTFRSLINRFGGARAALDALPEYAARAGRAVKVFSEKETDKELLLAQRLGVRFVAMSEPDYPAALRQVSDAPPVLAVRGTGDTLRRHALAIVGSRNASANG